MEFQDPSRFNIDKEFGVKGRLLAENIAEDMLTFSIIVAAQLLEDLPSGVFSLDPNHPSIHKQTRLMLSYTRLAAGNGITTDNVPGDLKPWLVGRLFPLVPSLPLISQSPSAVSRQAFCVLE